MNVFCCQICEKSFNSKSNLTQHLKRKIPCVKPSDVINKPRCDICFQIFADKRNLKNHKNKKTPCKPIITVLKSQINDLHKTINNKKNESEKYNNIIVNLKNKIKNIKTTPEKSNDSGYIYLIQPVLLLDTTKYKFGCSTLKDNSRLKHYGKDATLHFKYECRNPFKIEKYILEKLSENYEKIQHEYFDINDVEVVDVVKNILIWILEFEK